MQGGGAQSMQIAVRRALMRVLHRAGDLMKSMQVLVYKAEDGVLEVRIYAAPFAMLSQLLT